jgi:hypothetical protein
MKQMVLLLPNPPINITTQQSERVG